MTTRVRVSNLEDTETGKDIIVHVENRPGVTVIKPGGYHEFHVYLVASLLVQDASANLVE